MPINTVIRERRKALGLTQEQVAEQLGVTAPGDTDAAGNKQLYGRGCKGNREKRH